MAGTPNKQTTDVITKLAALGCDPIEGMARIALGDVPCPQCAASGEAGYMLTADGYIFDPASGTKMTCRICWGSGKEPIETKLRADMFKELTQYVAPKRRAVEHSGDESLLEAMLARLG